MNQAQTILKALEQVCGSPSPDQPISLHEPHFGGTLAWDYVRDCLDSGWVSTAGHWVSRFDQELCAHTEELCAHTEELCQLTHKL